MNLLKMVNQALKESENQPVLSVEEAYDSLFRDNELSTYDPDNSRWGLNDQIIVTTWKTTDDCMLLWRVDYSKQKDYKITRSRFTDNQMNNLHCHNYLEVTFVLEGKFRQVISGKDVTFSPGDIYLIDSQTMYHERLTAENGKVLFIGFSRNFFSETMFSSEQVYKRNQFLSSILYEHQKRIDYILFHLKNQRNEIGNLLQLILQEVMDKKVGSNYLLRGYATRILSILAENYTFSISASEKIQLRQMVFQDVQEYLFANYRDASIKELQKQFHYSRDYFNRLIQEQTGLTYTTYLQEIRLDKAALLLKQTDRPVSEISEAVGYNNLGYFYRLFQNRYGKTPRQYRIDE